MLKKIFPLTLIVFLSATFLFAEPLINKIDRLNKLKQEARFSESGGYYDESIRLAGEIKDLSELIEMLIESTRFWYKLDQQIKVARQIGADKQDSENFDTAVDFYEEARDLIGDDDPENADYSTEEGLNYISLAIDNTKEFFEEEKNKLAKKKNYQVEVVEISNNFYVVRLIPQRRDSLWRIAEYEFIYNDPFKWRIIYQANLDKISNPDLIYPGQRLVIPPLPQAVAKEDEEAAENEEAEGEEENEDESEAENEGEESEEDEGEDEEQEEQEANGEGEQ